MHSIENATQLQIRGEDSRPAARPELRLVSDPLSQRRWLYAASTSESTWGSAPDNTGGFSGTVSSTQLKSGFSRRAGDGIVKVLNPSYGRIAALSICQPISSTCHRRKLTNRSALTEIWSSRLRNSDRRAPSGH